MPDLVLPLKAVYFDEILAGTKDEEFRLCSPYWRKRLVAPSFDRVVLTRGYPKSGGVEGVSRLTRAWRGHRITTIRHPHFGTGPVEVFAIDVSVPLNERKDQA